MPTVADIIRETAARYGQDPATFLRMAQIESNMNPAARNPSGAAGLFQFMPKTAAGYGLADPMDPAASADAAVRLARDNSSHFQRTLGRDPSPAEIYLMHQQGAGGATSLLRNPDAPASSLVGRQAVLQNGGQDGMTGRDFADLWMTKFGALAPSTGAQNAAQPPVLAPPVAAAPQPLPMAPAQESPLSGVLSDAAAVMQPQARPKKRRTPGQVAIVGA